MRMRSAMMLLILVVICCQCCHLWAHPRPSAGVGVVGRNGNDGERRPWRWNDSSQASSAGWNACDVNPFLCKGRRCRDVDSEGGDGIDGVDGGDDVLLRQSSGFFGRVSECSASRRFYDIESDGDDQRRQQQQRHHHHQQQHTNVVQSVNRVKAWPPWPFSLLSRPSSASSRNGQSTNASNNENGNDNVSSSNSNSNNKSTKYEYPSTAALFWSYFKQRTRIGLRQCQQVGSQLWFHMPPSVPPIIILACIPMRQQQIAEQLASSTTTASAAATAKAAATNANEIITKRMIIPLISNPFARIIALGGLGMAVTSWAHMEVNRKRMLTPLPGIPYRSVSQVFLPPFLPMDVPEPEIEALEESEQEQDDDDDDEEERLNGNNNDDANTNTNANTNSKLVLRQRTKQFTTLLYENSISNPKTFHTTIIRQWRRQRDAKKRETAKIQRLSIFDELVALQALKRRSARQQRKQRKLIAKHRGNHKTNNKNSNRRKNGDGTDATTTAGGNAMETMPPTPNYALVTGASQGIGRAIAVELARWEVPLILVARDIDRLTSLAYDLEACYGVRCCILKADLSQPDAAERIHAATTASGLVVDILVNNAGIGNEGDAVDMSTDDTDRMVMVNTLTYAKLAQLYGRDMKQQRRGRILMVSSMSGLMSASPRCALYGATKAFGKSLSLSLAKEMEPHGVGVTCLIPGPVKDTEFRSRSRTERALCWHIPFYVRPASTVAHQGVKALLGGDTQVIPGWQNRAVSKLVRPMVPQRVEVMAVHAAWQPFRVPNPFSRRRRKHVVDSGDDNGSNGSDNDDANDDGEDVAGPKPNLQPRYHFQRPPTLLQLSTENEAAAVQAPTSKPSQDRMDGSSSSTQGNNTTATASVVDDDNGGKEGIGTKEGGDADQKVAKEPRGGNEADGGDTEHEEKDDQYADGSSSKGDHDGKNGGENDKEEETISKRHVDDEHPTRKKPDERRNKGVWGPSIGDGDEFELLEMDIGRGMPPAWAK